MLLRNADAHSEAGHVPMSAAGFGWIVVSSKPFSTCAAVEGLAVLGLPGMA